MNYMQDRMQKGWLAARFAHYPKKQLELSREGPNAAGVHSPYAKELQSQISLRTTFVR
jgi:hypothetical protein